MLPVLLAIAALLGPYSASGNFSADLQGAVDVRPATWGTADAYTWVIQMTAPAGYRVRILRLRGDLVAWPKTLPGEAPVERGQYAGVLLGFQTSAKDGSARCDPCADGTMLYIQHAMGADPVRAPFNTRVQEGGLLEPDGKLLVKVAAWLNTTGRPIHLEPTFTVVYQFEKESQ
jgi:hypothetical protein